MSSPRTVPLLPCGSIAEAERFATAIGFEVGYRQGSPHPYLALRSEEGIELHYFEILGFDTQASHGSCLVVVPDPVSILLKASGPPGRHEKAMAHLDEAERIDATAPAVRPARSGANAHSTAPSSGSSPRLGPCSGSCAIR